MLSQYIVAEFRTGKMKNVILIDKNKNVKTGLKKIINSIENHEVEEMLSSLEDLKTQILSDNDIVLFELTNENLNMIEILSRNIRFTSAKFIGMKSIENPDLEKRAFLSGLNGLIAKSSNQEKFEEMFNAVNAKGVYFNREILESIRRDHQPKEEKKLKEKIFDAINFIKGVQL